MKYLSLLAFSVLLITACSLQGDVTAMATLSGTQSDTIRGDVHFHDFESGTMRISGRIEGLNPGGVHGFHVHESGDCGDDGKAAGAHFHHGETHEPGLRESGDLPNVAADENGVASFNFTSSSISLREGDLNVAGRALMLHEKEDDYSQAETNAGGRIACGIIKISE